MNIELSNYWRIGILLIVSFIFNVIAIKLLIPYLHKLKYGQTVRKEGPETHQKKQGTPTMGGLVFIPVALISVFLVFPGFEIPGLMKDRFALAITLITIGYYLVGLIDDYLIVVKKDNQGLTVKQKLVLQSILALLFVFIFIEPMSSLKPELTSIAIPATSIRIDFGWFYPVIVFFLFVGFTNAVNLTDGLDGLASGNVIFALIPAFVLGYIQGNGSVQAFSISMIGALFAFLVFNHYPAKIMMGDTGSLPLGALITALYIILKQEVILLIVGGVFVMEAVSVILQVGSYKLRNKKRIFRMAPIHHHFELGGWSEQKVVRVFWAIGAILAVIGLILGVL